MLSEESEFKRLEFGRVCQLGEGNISNALRYWETVDVSGD